MELCLTKTTYPPIHPSYHLPSNYLPSYLSVIYVEKLTMKLLRLRYTRVPYLLFQNTHYLRTESNQNGFNSFDMKENTGFSSDLGMTYK